MIRGRKPKPLELKILQGNPGKRPLPNVPLVEKLSETTTVHPPSWLDKYAKKVWKDLSVKLIKSGILTSIDVNIFAQYCASYSLCVMTRKKIDEGNVVLTLYNDDGTVRYTQKSSYVTVYREALSDVMSLGAQLGLSPAERVRLRITNNDKDKETDFFQEGILLRQQNGR